MKKFLIFLVAIITSVCIGMTFYQFAKNEEVISVKTQTIYVNYGDKLSLDDIGFTRKDASKDTKINFNAGGDEVTSIIKYDEASKSYIPTQKGGATTVKISTSNRKYKTLTIDIVVGIGTEENPYYISTEEQLFNIGTKYSMDACYKLVNDIDVKSSHAPIGLIGNKYHEFMGRFDGNFNVINNLKINTCDNGGLFAILGSNSSVYNLSINNALLEGSYVNVGTVAGICYGSINKVVVSNTTITNGRASSNTGAVVGLLQTDKFYNITAGILRTSAYTEHNNTITASGNLGGLAGKVDSAVIHACYTKLNLNNTSSYPTGGLVGQLLVNRNTYIRESYSTTKISARAVAGNIVGDIDLSSGTSIDNVDKSLVLVGLYFDSGVNSLTGVGSDTNGFASATSFAVNGKTSNEMRIKSTYVYYVSSSNNVVFWDKVWQLVDGELPTLTFVSKFDDIVLDDDKTPTPDGGNTSSPDITNPDAPETDTKLISNKQDLVTVFQSSNTVVGNYIITNNINLGGMEWKPVNFSGSLTSANNTNYTISNFKINASGLYAGFFYTLSSAKVTNIKFDNVTILENGLYQAVGTVAGLINGDAIIKNVSVSNSNITTSAKYSGGIVGYTVNSIITISNCNLLNITISNKTQNAGGIVGYSSSNTIIDNCKFNSPNSISAIDRAGGITAVNYGNVTNCIYVGNISSILSTASVGYFGGLTATNHGIFGNCIMRGNISVDNSAESSSSVYYYVGGLAGYNLGTFTKCTVHGDKITGNRSTNEVFLGGLTGYNTGALNNCFVGVSVIGEVRPNIYVAGLSVFNYGGKIVGGVSFGDRYGYQVSGLVRVNANNGIVDSCMAGKNILTIATFSGVQVTTFAYDISSGTISNCVVSATLNGTSNDGWMAGFVGFMPYNNNKFGTLSYNIANITFTGAGSKFLDIAQDGLFRKTRTTGTITDCLINSKAKTSDAIVSEYDKGFAGYKAPASNSNYVIATESQMYDIKTYLDVERCDFDIASGNGTSVWRYFDNTRLPLPREVMKTFELFAG